jgi:glycosyltransferase involved in cell wall biosynthesis
MLDPWFKTEYPLKHLKKSFYWPFGDYRVLRDADAVFFTSVEEKVRAAQSFSLYSAKGIVVAYGTSGPPCDLQEQRSEVHRRFPDLARKRVALFLGRIHPKKGCDILIKAFAQTLARDPAWHLVLAGPDQVGLKSKLLALANSFGIEDRVTWTGSVSGELKWGLFGVAEVFVLPSHQENFGIAVAESLACGVPALLSKRVNIWQEVEEDGAGYAAEDSLEGTAALLTRWHRLSASKRDIARTHARKCFEKRFEIRRASQDILRELAIIVSANKKAVES